MRAPALPRVISRRLRPLSYAVLAILLLITAFVAAATLPVLFGYHTYVVNGGSMAPSLGSGSVAVAKATSPFALEVGDIIARRDTPDGPAVLHRIARITDDDTGRVLYTQGDANRTEDPEPVILLGSGDKVIYSVPYAGYILNFGGSTFGRIMLLGAPLMLAAMYLYEKLPLRRKQEPPDSPQTSAENNGPLRGLHVVPPSLSFQPADNPIRVSLVGLSDFRGLMNAQRTLSNFPAVKRASILSFERDTAVLEVTLRVSRLADEIVDELQGGTGYRILVEEAEPDMQRLCLRFVNRVFQPQVARAA